MEAQVKALADSLRVQASLPTSVEEKEEVVEALVEAPVVAEALVVVVVAMEVTLGLLVTRSYLRHNPSWVALKTTGTVDWSLGPEACPTNNGRVFGVCHMDRTC